MPQSVSVMITQFSNQATRRRMSSLNRLLLLVSLFLVAMYPQISSAQVQQGTCAVGTAQQALDINNVSALLFNGGQLFYDGSNARYEVPKGSGLHSVFAGGIWLGGTVNGNIRTAGATYAQGSENYEFFPGPLNEDGSLPNPEDCSAYDRMYKVSAVDIADFVASGNATPDLAEWPIGLGAPACVDENGNFRCDDGEPAVEPISREQLIDLDAGQIPNIKGDLGIWWIMNDVGGSHQTTLSPPIGMEVSVLAFAFSRGDALGDATFYEYTFTYRGQQDLEDTFLTIWSDPDLGNYQDDYIGSDPELGLGFVYNADNDDEAGSGGYGVGPPALGYDFFLGPVTDDDGVDNDGDGEVDEEGERMSMTRFGYYNNTADPRTGNPDTDVDYYNYMRGLWRDGTPWTEGGMGDNPSGTPVNFVYPNSGSASTPTPGYWSEVCPTEDCSTSITAGDRRFTMSAGPFTMSPGEVQQVTYGIVWAQGSNNHTSLQAMKAADQLAQRAFDLNFALAPPPPAPNVEAVELNGQAALTWSYAPTSSNYLGGFDETDLLIAGIPGVEDSTYTFEGFNVYRYPSQEFNNNDRERIATFDVVNGITTVIDTMFSPELGGLVPFVAARGTDSGVQFHYVIQDQQLTSYTDYFYGVSAYAYNQESTPDVLESQASNIVVRPASLEPGSIANSEINGTLAAVRTAGSGTANISATVIDPAAITGDTYEVRVVEVSDGEESFLTYNVVNTSTGGTVFSGEDAFSNQGVLLEPTDALTNIVDGLAFFSTLAPDLPPEDVDLVPDWAGDGRGIVEVANPNTTVCEGGAVDEGCEDYGGNTVWLDASSDGDYLVTAPGQDRGVGGLGRYVAGSEPYDFEIRFTEECATPGNCLGVYALSSDMITSVPFELWNTGPNTPDDPSDDVRMIPFPLPEPTSGPESDNWADVYTAEQEFDFDGDGETDATVPVTQRIYWQMPDRPDGYDLFEQAANGFGGPGATYDFENDGDTQVDINPADGTECANQHYYADFCWNGLGTFVYPVGRLLFGDLAGDGTTPEAGTTVRFLTTPKDLFSAGDVYELDTSELGFVTDDPAAAEEALAQIGAVPNPYRGVSAYERSNLERRVRFVNLPDEATIRIFTLSGTLIRTIQANNTRSIDWDLTTEENLPVASGMYLVHVETNIGEKVIKLGVVNRQVRFDAF